MSQCCLDRSERDADRHPLSECFSQRGRKKTEDNVPLIRTEIQKIIEPQAQADPEFQTTLAFTRVTAGAIRSVRDIRAHHRMGLRARGHDASASEEQRPPAS
jgi:hypothetical protein